MFQVKMKNAGGGFTKTQWAAQLEAAYWWAKAWNDDGFQKQVLSFGYSYDTYSGKLWWKKKTGTVNKKGFTYTDDSPDVILAKVLSGSETLNPKADGAADVEVVLSNQSGVLGWTYPNVLTEWLSAWFISSASIAEQSGNRAHEYAHKCGYDHPSNRTWDREWSVPYTLGDLTEAWVKANYVKGEFALHNFDLVTDTTAA